MTYMHSSLFWYCKRVWAVEFQHSQSQKGGFIFTAEFQNIRSVWMRLDKAFAFFPKWEYNRIDFVLPQETKPLSIHRSFLHFTGISKPYHTPVPEVSAFDPIKLSQSIISFKLPHRPKEKQQTHQICTECALQKPAYNNASRWLDSAVLQTLQQKHQTPEDCDTQARGSCHKTKRRLNKTLRHFIPADWQLW